VSPSEIEKAFRKHAEKCVSPGSKHICFDGKSLNGSFSHTKDARAAQVFSAFCKEDQIVLAGVPIGKDKDHEIQAFQDLLMELNLKDVVVTADALHCQKKLSRTQR